MFCLFLTLNIDSGFGVFLQVMAKVIRLKVEKEVRPFYHSVVREC